MLHTVKTYSCWWGAPLRLFFLFFKYVLGGFGRFVLFFPVKDIERGECNFLVELSTLLTNLKRLALTEEKS